MVRYEVLHIFARVKRDPVYTMLSPVLNSDRFGCSHQTGMERIWHSVHMLVGLEKSEQENSVTVTQQEVVGVMLEAVRSVFKVAVLFLTVSCVCCRNLPSIQDREICCYSVSCKEKDNIGMHLFPSVMWCRMGL